MDRLPVKSSKISSIGYDKNNHTLEVEFLEGGVFQYYKVPSDMYRKLIHAKSIGSYLATYITDLYNSKKI